MWWFWKRSGRNFAGGEPSGAGDSPRVEAAIRSDPGCHREGNEDSARFVQPTDETLLASRGILLVVADGMGGHEAGEVASRTASDEIVERYYAGAGEPHASLREAFLRANARIRDLAAGNPAWKGMGTTCTALVVRGRAAFAAHVGDSRCYLLRDGSMYQMTEDHSMVMELVRRGNLTLEQARNHEDRNVILRSLGTQPEVAVSVWNEPFPVRDGDRFLLCSDGLYDLVQDSEIQRIASSFAPGAATERLVALARQRGGYDNITVGILTVGRPDSAGDSSLPDTKESEVLR